MKDNFMTDFKLRDYQIDALNVIHNDLQSMNNVLLSAIMGAGKTVICSRLVNRYFFETKRRFLILNHKQELVEQFHKTFKEKTDIPMEEIGICCAALKQKDIEKRLTIGTIQTFINQVYDYTGCDLLIIDEVHRVEIGTGSQYDQIILHLQTLNPNLRILGVTATPFRLSTGFCYGNKNNKDVLFEKLNHQIKYAELKEKGYLVPLRGEISIDDSYYSDIENNVKISGDYVIQDVSDVMTRTIHIDSAVNGIKEYCQGFKHICVFCCTIEHAEILKNMLNSAGEQATTIHSKLTDIERSINMQSWKTGKTRIMTSINILVEGFDFPPLDCLVFARPTLSAALFLQGIGRLLRPSPDTGKTEGFLLDLTDNTQRFGTDLDNIKIKIPYSVEKKIQEEQEKSLTKTCPECDAECFKSLMTCECGYIFQEIASISPDKVNTESVVFETAPPPPPEIYDIGFVEFHLHHKKGKPDSIRVEYHNNNIINSRICSEWLCFEHGGYATQKALQWWDKMTDTNIIPETSEQALEMIFDSCIRPTKILVGQDGDYQRVLEHYFDDNEEEMTDNFDYGDDIPF